MVRLSRRGVRIPDDLAACAPGRLRALLGYVPSASESDLERLELAVELYGLLCRKYRFDRVDLHDYLAQLRPEALPGLDRLERALAEPDDETRLGLILDYLEVLKGVITSEERYEPVEDIYQKRHITIDIPSMYGSYHETKFDCLGLSLRLESIANALFENRIQELDLGLITQATFHRIHQLLTRFNQALQLDGIRSAEFERQLEFLEDSLSIKGFSLTQYLDIFKGFAQAVQNIVKDTFHNLHGANLSRILPGLRPGQILPKYLPPEPLEDAERLHHRITEIFFRDRIATALGLQQLDGFIGRILQTLHRQAEALPPDQLVRLLLYEPREAVVAIDAAGGTRAGVVHLGTKGFNLVKLHGLGFRVPPGFIVTTEVFRCRQVIEGYAPAQRTFQDQIRQALQRLEQASGKRFGDPADPLLLSVRSGSAVSQPGMMDTLLDVGNNEEITAAVAARTGNAWFAWDNYRRFLQNYGMAHDLTRDDFDAVIREFKRRTGIPLKRQFTGDQMRARGAGLPAADPGCGHRDRRRAFRATAARAAAGAALLGISQSGWRTGASWASPTTGARPSPSRPWCTGTGPSGSGTGVIFTHNPRWSGEVLRLWGDFTTTNQGEDVVSGLVHTMPVSLAQQEIERRETDITLETHFPGIYRELSRWARVLIEDHGWSPQEIEFTFESPASGRPLHAADPRHGHPRKPTGAVLRPGGVPAGRPARSRDRRQRGGHERSSRVQPRGHCALARARTDHAPDPRPHGHGAGRHPGNSRGRRPVDGPGRGDLPRGRRGAPARQDLRRRVHRAGLRRAGGGVHVRRGRAAHGGPHQHRWTRGNGVPGGDPGAAGIGGSGFTVQGSRLKVKGSRVQGVEGRQILDPGCRILDKDRKASG